MYLVPTYNIYYFHIGTIFLRLNRYFYKFQVFSKIVSILKSIFNILKNVYNPTKNKTQYKIIKFTMFLFILVKKKPFIFIFKNKHVQSSKERYR